MTIKITKESVIKFLICLTCLISVAMIFAFFGVALENVNDIGVLKLYGSMFEWMFGVETDFITKSINTKAIGLIILFIIQIIMMIIAIVFFLCIIFGLNKKKISNILSFVFLLLLVVSVILAFLTKQFIKEAVISDILKIVPGSTREGVESTLKDLWPNCRISNGPIIYASLGIIGFVSLSAAMILNNVGRD